ncbi:MAG: peptidoglycan DD-metalloendopeptidase family protein [Deltaproteobacteria bacterium]|jgi:murein DD-endopeptidase MepM/ murein hydrolase activator NlpD|nr:peptidoglycan DD-metalloendopeptidase family protein [Deltaproteobacteria bacterium]
MPQKSHLSSSSQKPRFTPNKNQLVPLLALLLLLGGGLAFLKYGPLGADESGTEYSYEEELQLLEADARAACEEAGALVLNLEAEEAEPVVIQAEVSRGDTVSKILEAWLTGAEIHALAASCKSVFPLHRIRQGQPYTVHTRDEKLIRFEYEIDSESKLVVSRGDEGFVAEREEIEYNIVLHRVDGVIASNLFNAMVECGETAALAMALADVFAWEINFIQDLRVDDSFTLLVEKRYRDGEFKGYGRLLAAYFTNQGSRYETFLFTDDAGHSLYFNAEGESLRRAFLKAPLAFNRISSGFSHRRLHPVLKDWRAHPAIDYAAPAGTPVKSVGRGVITFKGFNKGAGNYVAVKHMNGYETMYLHLSRFAGGIQKGAQVKQGQVVGYVGQTGYATGPHLDFRMKRNGAYVNPLRELTPRDQPVNQREMPRFLATQELCRDFLEDRRNLAEYSRSMPELKAATAAQAPS